jgi:hypothetical protein
MTYSFFVPVQLGTSLREGKQMREGATNSLHYSLLNLYDLVASEGDGPACDATPVQLPPEAHASTPLFGFRDQKWICRDKIILAFLRSAYYCTHM